MLNTDNRYRAVDATMYLSEPRVEHFWDTWSFGVQTYTRQFRYPPNELAWDIFVLYGSKIVWADGPPEPAVWMQHRDLDIGVKYSQEKLEAELKSWAR